MRSTTPPTNPNALIVATTLAGIAIEAERTPDGWRLLRASAEVDAVWWAGAREHLDVLARLVEDDRRRAATSPLFGDLVGAS